MTFLFNTLDFPADSRMTGIWSNRNIDPPVGDELASGHFIRLPGDQHVELEGDFLNAHMPFWVAGFGGVFPDGQPWLFVLQKAPADVAVRLLGIDDPAWPLRDSLFRALRFNDGAVITDEYVWSRWDLLRIYEWKGIDPDAVIDWPVADLLLGLLTECCYADLGGVVGGRTAGCAFLGAEHDCEFDVFTDVFARWSRGQMPVPAERPHGGELDVEDWRVTAEDLARLSGSELRAVAKELGVRTRRKSGKRRSRHRVTELVLEVLSGEED